MSVLIPGINVIVAVSPRARMAGIGGVCAGGAARLPSDPLFLATLTLRNVAAGSRYRITRSDTGAELAAGVASGSGLVNVVIPGVSCFSNPQVVTVTVRKATEAPKYLPYEAQTEISKLGGLAFVAQIPDPIA